MIGLFSAASLIRRNHTFEDPEFEPFYNSLTAAESAIKFLYKSAEEFSSSVDQFSRQFENYYKNSEIFYSLFQPGSELYDDVARYQQASKYINLKHPTLVKSTIDEELLIEADIKLKQCQTLLQNIENRDDLYKKTKLLEDQLALLMEASTEEERIKTLSVQVSDLKNQLEQSTNILKNELTVYESTLTESFGKLFHMYRDCQINYFRTGHLSFEESNAEPILSSRTIDRHQTLSISNSLLEIGAGKSHNLSIDMKKDESLTWKFRTEAKDIGFQVDFKKNNEPSIPCQVIFPYQRLEADKETQIGTFTADSDGRLILNFDNKYSYFRSKVVGYIYGPTGSDFDQYIEENINELSDLIISLSDTHVKKEEEEEVIEEEEKEEEKEEENDDDEGMTRQNAVMTEAETEEETIMFNKQQPVEQPAEEEQQQEEQQPVEQSQQQPQEQPQPESVNDNNEEAAPPLPSLTNEESEANNNTDIVNEGESNNNDNEENTGGKKNEEKEKEVENDQQGDNNHNDDNGWEEFDS